MKRIRRGKGRRKQVRIGAADASLTGSSGLAAVTELVEVLGVAEVFDRQVGPIKQRPRGLSGGEFLISLGVVQLFGEDCLAGFDRLRGDAAGQRLAPVPAPAQTTAGALARRFGPRHLRGIEAGVAELACRWLSLLAPRRRAQLSTQRPTIDLDSTDVEVYGRAKVGVAYNYQGQRAGRPHVAVWAEAGIALAADLLAGNDDVRPRCADLLGRALSGLPPEVTGRPRLRADAGYFTAELAQAADAAGCDYAVAARRNSALWRELAAVDPDAWVPARGMPGAQVAAIDYAPAGWPEDAYTIIRRVRVDAEDVSTDPRSRRRRTIPKDQLALALDGELDHVWAVSFIVTNLPTATATAAFPDIVEVEAWFRRRTDIEECFREAKLGAGLNHLPSGDAGVNTVWMWGALLAGAFSTMLQSLTGLDTEHGRARHARLRHELLRVPARVIRHARGLTLRLPPGRQLLPTVLARLRALPALT